MERMKHKGELSEKLRTARLLVVQFGAASCTPCTAIRQKLDSWLDEYGQAEGLYVPIDEFPEAAAEQGIFTVPAVLVFAEGRLTVRESGCFSLEDVLRRAERYRKLME